MARRKQEVSKIAILTSGGDAPGMNACIRAVVRQAAAHHIEVVGIRNGYEGLLEGQFFPLSLRSVGNIIQRGGTILGSSRAQKFKTKQGRKEAYARLRSLGIGSLIVLGGDGTMAGAGALSKEHSVQVIGVPCTIDNDLAGTDRSVGFDTAVETAVDCLDKIRDTADSHGRVFVMEVMGKNTGHLAVETGLATGAEFVVIPENPFRSRDLVRKIQQGIQRGKTGSIVIVAEREQPGFALQLAEKIQTELDRGVRAMVLGHLQRGGGPMASDRNLASRLGAFAVELILGGKTRMMTGVRCDKEEAIPFSKVLGKKREVERHKLELIDVLSV